MLDSVLYVGHILKPLRTSLLLADATGERSLRCGTADRSVMHDVM
jgi:hypothetical protein